MRKAFSLVELLITCAVIAIVLGLIATSYVGLSQTTRTIAQNKDQGAFQQVIEAFHMTGGNIGAILDPAKNNGASAEVQAAALTKVLKQSTSSDARKQLGSVSAMVSPDLVIVPYGNDSTTVNDGNLRMVYSNGVLSLKPSGSGFAITSSTANSKIASRKGSPEPSTVDVLVNAAAPSTASGTKFAAANQYVYDEDAVPVAAPSVAPSTANTSPLIGLGAIVSVVQGNTVIAAPLTYAQYIDPSYQARVFVYRIDGQKIPANIIPGITAQASLGSGAPYTLTAAGELSQNVIIGNQSAEVDGIAFTLPLSDIFSANLWTNSTEVLSAIVSIDQSQSASKTFTAPSEAITTVTASPIDLAVSFVGTPANPFSSGSFQADGTKLANGTAVPANAATVSLSFEDEDGNTAQPASITVAGDPSNPDLLLNITPTT